MNGNYYEKFQNGVMEFVSEIYAPQCPVDLVNWLFCYSDWSRS